MHPFDQRHKPGIGTKAFIARFDKGPSQPSTTISGRLFKILKDLRCLAHSRIHKGKIQRRNVSYALQLEEFLQHSLSLADPTSTPINISKGTSNRHNLTRQSSGFVQGCDGVVEHPFLSESNGEAHVRQMIAGLQFECLPKLL